MEIAKRGSPHFGNLHESPQPSCPYKNLRTNLYEPTIKTHCWGFKRARIRALGSWLAVRTLSREFSSHEYVCFKSLRTCEFATTIYDEVSTFKARNKVDGEQVEYLL